jgi:UDP-2,4-diacetamido-2,4,6-trideoxy-beta-L-altropyranose hydrolase
MSHRKAAIRFDVSHRVGIGHMKRALSIASRLEKCIFVVCKGGAEYLRQIGFLGGEIIEIQSASVDWLNHIPNGWPLIFDICYSNNSQAAEFEIAAACEVSTKVTVIDSMPPDHFMGVKLDGELIPDVVITPYYLANEYRPKPIARYWGVGPRYCVLDDAYGSYALISNAIPDQKRILITCGGSDPTGLTVKCIDALMNFEGFLDVVMGPLFTPQLFSELKLLEQLNTRIKLHHQPECLASLIANAALVVGRPGLIRYEAASLGRNTILYSDTNSYYEYYKAFSSSGMGKIFFKCDIDGEKEFILELKRVAFVGEGDAMFGFNSLAKSIVQSNGIDNVLNLIFRE